MITGNPDQRWEVADGYCRTVYNSIPVKFVTYLETGFYLDRNLDLIWQIKSEGEKWWDNLEGEPTEEMKALFNTRRLIRLATVNTHEEAPVNKFIAEVPAPTAVQIETLHKIVRQALSIFIGTGISEDNAKQILIDMILK